ncbi:hypothetical protein ONS95_003045 [Cadophora gregata]|uniref:uncharacterized protein n=1 Tax=Cadophora gregata TaxID=51156 RepID=UPI0026DDA4CC|nr:uncharacterized protein ONS95_003045 [Cadophora gregata]KAK0108225.1 hypothetical protein ONS95_003045 [Cadophora gregata]KAK0109183.1 hypothetical protein ONS96_003006 [Cadophora gregata f. sp. sojae]
MARLLWTDPFWNGKRKPFIIGVVMSSLSVIVMFFVVMSYLYGSVWRSTHRASHLNILAVDYDGGVVGKSLSAGYSALEGDKFPTLHFRSSEEFATVEDIRNAVCRGDYWAAIFAQNGASDRLSAALGGGAAASGYNSSETLTYVYNEARYPTVQSSHILSNMQTLIGTATSIYGSLNGTSAAKFLNTDDANATLALLNPISASSINIMPTPQGTKVLYNTVTLVLPIIQQFFFLLALNGISTHFGIYGYLSSLHVGLIRMVVAISYTFLASLTLVGYIWAFKEDWGVSGGQFVLTWMAMWLYMHVNFLVLDAATAFVPLAYLSFFVLPWAIINITSTIFPFELSPGFYKLGYALPGHQVVSMLFQIWSGGCNNELSRSLPVLFAWEIFGWVVSGWGVVYRNRAAREEVLKEEADARKPPQTSSTSNTQEVQEKPNPELENLRRKIERRNTGPPGLPMPFQGMYLLVEDGGELGLYNVKDKRT